MVKGKNVKRVRRGDSKEIIHYDNFPLVLFFAFFRIDSNRQERRSRRKMGLKGGEKENGIEENKKIDFCQNN